MQCTQCGATESPITQDIISLFVEVKDIDTGNWKCSTCFREEAVATKEEKSEITLTKEEKKQLKKLGFFV